MAREDTESVARDLLFAILARRFGEQKPTGQAASASEFRVKDGLGGGTFSIEGKLDYALPNGERLNPKTDILLTRPDETYVAIELKFLSAVTDQFKARAYDALHLKRAFGDRLVNVRGISERCGNREKAM